jgi:hypothetical protein
MNSMRTIGLGLGTFRATHAAGASPLWLTMTAVDDEQHIGTNRYWYNFSPRNPGHRSPQTLQGHQCMCPMARSKSNPSHRYGLRDP